MIQVSRDPSDPAKEQRLTLIKPLLFVRHGSKSCVSSFIVQNLPMSQVLA